MVDLLGDMQDKSGCANILSSESHVLSCGYLILSLQTQGINVIADLCASLETTLPRREEQIRFQENADWSATAHFLNVQF